MGADVLAPSRDGSMNPVGRADASVAFSFRSANHDFKHELRKIKNLAL
jgi:hypothetical protein